MEDCESIPSSRSIMNKEVLEEIKKLHAEYMSDVTLRDDNLHEQTLRAPAIKGKWIGQLWEHDYEYKILERELNVLVKNQKFEIQKKLKVDVPEADIKKLQLKYAKNIKKVESRMDDLRFLIEYLRKYQNSSNFFGNDIDHAIQSTKLEQC